jgi:ribosome-binding factor A
MRKTRRTSRVGATLRDAIAEVFRHDLKDSRLAMISITEVEIGPDLHEAKVFLSGLNEDETKKIAEDLNGQQGRIRHFLGKRIRLRVTPELDFRYDETSARAGRIEQLLHDIKKNDQS